MPDETNREKHKVIVLKNQNYDITCSVSVSAQYAEGRENIHAADCGMRIKKAEGSKTI
jgi:hypothetical protein